MMMNTDHHGNRIDRLEAGVSTLATDFASVKAEMRGLASGQGSILDKLDAQDKARPGVSSILPWLAALVAVLGLLGGAYVQPLLQRIERIDRVQESRVELLTAMRIDIAILKHDAERKPGT